MNKVINFVDSYKDKGTLAEETIKSDSVEYDCAIPIQWIDHISTKFTDAELKQFGNIASHFVYVYDNSGEHRTEYLMPLTKVGCKILGKLALYV